MQSTDALLISKGDALSIRHFVDIQENDPLLPLCRQHFGNNTKLVCFDGDEGGSVGLENIAPDTLVRLG